MQLLRALSALSFAVLVFLLPLISFASFVPPTSLAYWFDDLKHTKHTRTATLHLETLTHHCDGPRVLLPSDVLSARLSLQASNRSSSTGYSPLDIETAWLVADGIWGVRGVETAADKVVVVLQDDLGKQATTQVKWEHAGMGVRSIGTCSNRNASSTHAKRSAAELTPKPSAGSSEWTYTLISIVFLLLFFVAFLVSQLLALQGTLDHSHKLMAELLAQGRADGQKKENSAVTAKEGREKHESESGTTEEWEVRSIDG
ncbi:hypothetical protein JCM8097_003174 [Rhodosporidiobolus ruineniae]